jgi:hypothetical protein
MESGAVASVAYEAGVPFAVLRAICDPADRAVPPAALVALDAVGRVATSRLLSSIVAQPGQIGSLLVLARDAALARHALRSRAAYLSSDGRPPPASRPDWVRPEAILDEDFVPDGIV